MLRDLPRSFGGDAIIRFFVRITALATKNTIGVDGEEPAAGLEFVEDFPLL